MRRFLLPALLVLLPTLLRAQDKSVNPGINDPFKSPDLKKFLGAFEGESREIFAARSEILKRCNLKKDQAIADIGAGTGLFTRLFAKEVGPDGKVFAVDIAKSFLEHIAAKAKKEGLKNIVLVQCDQRSTNLAENGIDLAFVCDTYHHFELPFRTLDSIHKALKPGGRLIVIDFHRIPGKSREWTLKHVRAGQEVFQKEIASSGFKLVEEVKLKELKENYFLRFEKIDRPKAKKEKPAPVGFNRDVRPILSDACFTCHGPDKSKRKANLRLDTPEGGKAIVGSSTESELLDRVLSPDPKKVMPPPKTGKNLSPDQVAVLRRWIAQGAEWEPHAAFVAPKRPPIPEVKSNRARNPVDRFLLARLEREGLTFSPEAPRHTLLRRVAQDLTGLPPLGEIEAFLADTRPDAYERLVERLLASPSYGERLALDWLDAARYADSNGYQSDRDRIMWPWRDWVVRAFNANVPFDQFTLEQIAGDLLPGATLEQRIATGFHRNHMLNGEGGRVAEESRIDYVVDRVDTTATVWLGLTLGCARCHDHKFDPFSMREYYSLFAFFNNVPETGGVDRGGNAAPVLALPTPQQTARRAVLQKEVGQLEIAAKQHKEFAKHLKGARDALAKFDKQIVAVMVMEERPTPRQTHVLIRGAWDKPGEKVSAGVPSWLTAFPKDAPANRLGLARWLVDEGNPLTARVVVNRYWQLLFGEGLVRTAEDFGVQGDPPSHPELLDWLAAEFVRSGWDVKALLRLLVTSEAYRQSSRQTQEATERDPDNRLLERGPRFRLSSTALRDQALALGGLLVQTQGGPPVKPYQPPGIWEEMSFGTIRYVPDRGPNLHRRSLYTFWRRTVGPTNLFDVSSRQVCVVRQARTNTPVHALIALNETTYTEAARAMAARAVREAGSTTDERLTWLFRLATARNPDQVERAILSRTHARLLVRYRADQGAARKLIGVGESPVDTTTDAAELAALAGACNLILNLDEVLTKE